MVYKIQKNFVWPALAVECYATVRRAQTAKNRLKSRKNVTRLQLFPTKEPLTSLCIDILGPFIRTSRRKEHLLVITERSSNMTKTIPLKGVSAAEVAKHFVNSWVFNYGPPEDSVARNGRYFTSNFLEDVCRIMSVKKHFNTTHHVQMNGKVERYN